ncbi:MAG: glycosyltransferase family 2 protein [Nitrospiraceae bacterium]
MQARRGTLAHRDPCVHIVILNWNGLNDTLECLQSVSELEYKNRQVVVIDNGSEDSSCEKIRAKHPHITLLENKVNLGYTGGNNVGLRYALENGADYVWLLNNDLIVNRDCLKRLVSAAETDPNIGLISPVISYDYARIPFNYYGLLVDRKVCRLEPVKTPSAWEDDELTRNLLVIGTALLVRSSVVRRIGYLDERYFAYHEDLDYSLRAIGGGFRTFLEPQAFVHHKGSRSLGEDSPIKAYLLKRNYYLLWTERLHGWQKYSFCAQYLRQTLREAVECKTRGMELTACAYLDGAWSALCGRYGNWRQAREMPRALMRGLFWHPYFWISLLEGHFGAIMCECTRRLFLKLRHCVSG